MSLAYAGTIGLIAANYAADSPSLEAAGSAAFMFGAPAVHMAHGNELAIVGSLTLRGVFLMTLGATVFNCLEIGYGADETPTPGWCDTMPSLMLAELVAMPLIDFGLAWKTVERPAPSDRLVSLSVVPPSGSRPGMLGLVGRF
jgi:hypothetical protein